MRQTLFLVLLILCLGRRTTAGTEPVSVSFYECRRCSSPPTLDGRLDDACWQNLPLMEGFYQYWSPTPKPPPLRTVAKLCYDDNALYIGITLYDEQVEKIKATIRNRDNPETWRDDCVEIMIDPRNSGTGYFKFTTNFLAARYDEKTINMVIDAGWNAEGWQVKTSKDKSAWFIELFLPWSDLGAKPKEGDLWSFDLVRYGYSSGSFRGVTWSLGGSYAAPQNFGYLSFGQFTPSIDERLQRIAQVVSKTKGQRFRLLLPDVVLTHEPSGWTKQELRSWVAEAFSEVEKTLHEAEAAIENIPVGDQRKRLETKVKEARIKFGGLKTQQAQSLSPSAASIARENALALRREAAELKWEGLLWALVGSP
jgi:hypothetical protein